MGVRCLGIYLSKMRWLVFLIHGGYYCRGLWRQMRLWVCRESFFVVLSLRNVCCLLYSCYIFFSKVVVKMSISLLSLLVGHDGPSTLGLNLRSLRFGISIYSDLCVSFFIWSDLWIFGSPQKLLVLGIIQNFVIFYNIYILWRDFLKKAKSFFVQTFCPWMLTLHHLVLVYSKSFFNLVKIFVLRLFKIAEHQADFSKFKKGFIIKFFCG